MEKQWQELTPQEKQEALFQRWLQPKDSQGNDLKFQSPQAEKLYKERVTRLKDAIQLKKTPDRVPIFPMLSFFPAFYGGITPQESMYDYDKLAEATRKYVLDFEPDYQFGIGLATPGRVYDILDYKLYAWPGHGVSPTSTYQCQEAEYMMADEYDEFIRDPSYFFTNTYFPRIFGKLEAFKMLPTCPPPRKSSLSPPMSYHTDCLPFRKPTRLCLKPALKPLNGLGLSALSAMRWHRWDSPPAAAVSPKPPLT